MTSRALSTPMHVYNRPPRGISIKQYEVAISPGVHKMDSKDSLHYSLMIMAVKPWFSAASKYRLPESQADREVKMRVELMYEPGSSIRRVLDILETAIAEERLPVPVQLIEMSEQPRRAPVVRIEGQEFSCLQLTPVGTSCSGNEISTFIDQVRHLLAEKWSEFTKI